MVKGMEHICKELNMKDEEILRVVRVLMEDRKSAAQISAAQLLCRLSKSSNIFNEALGRQS